MCYTGKCRYEMYWGECNKRGKYPDDALCVIIEKEIEKESNAALDESNQSNEQTLDRNEIMPYTN